jgi:hypothetical protein
MRSLPPVNAGSVPRTCSTVELVFNLLFASLFLNMPGVRRLFESAVIGPVVTMPFKFGPWWELLAAALIVNSLVQATMNAINLVRPDWSRLRAATLVATNGFLLIVAVYILRVRNFVTVADTVSHPARYAHATNELNELIVVTLLCLVLASAVTVVTNVRKLVRRLEVFPNVHQDAGAI